MRSISPPVSTFIVVRRKAKTLEKEDGASRSWSKNTDGTFDIHTPAGVVTMTVRSCSGCCTGSRCSVAASSRLKMAVVAPMPMASVRMATRP
jgi:hypothetical protein